MSKNKSDLEQSFDAAVEAIRNSNENKSNGPSDEEKLQFYGLYKQATYGDCDISQPWAIQIVERAKWNAWNSNKGMRRNDAMLKYCELYLKVTKKYGN
jgi:diazepam-binding inhibitor (GABA receptor modulator, acyl-CoA-binding protein)